MSHIAIGNDANNGILFLRHALNIINVVNIMTFSAGTVNVVTEKNHGFEATIDVDIQGANQTEYNGTHTNITVIDSVTFSFALSGSPATPATGVITAQSVGIDNAALKYFGADPYDEQDSTVLDPIIKIFFSSYSWDLTNHVLVEDMTSARLTKLDVFRGLCHLKWKAMGLCDNPPIPIVILFTGADKIALEAYRDMVSTETTVLATKTTILEIDNYTPTYLL